MFHFAGRILIFVGIVIFAVDALIALLDKAVGIGRFPGDIVVRRRNLRFYFPVTTSIIVSVALSILFWVLRE